MCFWIFSQVENRSKGQLSSLSLGLACVSGILRPTACFLHGGPVVSTTPIRVIRQVAGLDWVPWNATEGSRKMIFPVQGIWAGIPKLSRCGDPSEMNFPCNPVPGGVLQRLWEKEL